MEYKIFSYIPFACVCIVRIMEKTVLSYMGPLVWVEWEQKEVGLEKKCVGTLNHLVPLEHPVREVHGSAKLNEYPLQSSL